MSEKIETCKLVAINKSVVEKVKKRIAGIEEMAALSDLFKVLGDVTRVRILNALFVNEMCVCEIAFLLEMSQSAISHQLRVLKYSRLVKNRKEGKSVYYSLDDEHIIDMFKCGVEHIKEICEIADKVTNMKTVKKEIILEGLTCALCASKIETEISGLEGIGLVSMNFMEKKLTLEVDGSNMENTIDNIGKIIKRIEPDIVVKEKEILKSNRKIFLLTGICCELCADNVEKEIRNLDGVKNALLDFDKGTLNIEFFNKKDEKRIVKEARETARKIISGIRIIDREARIKKIDALFVVKDALAFILFVSSFFMEWELLKLIILGVSYVLVGGGILLRAVKNIAKGDIFDENFLMAIATIGAFVIGDWPEAVAVMLFYKAGMYLEKIALDRSKKSIAGIMDLRPEFANLKKENDVLKVSPEEVKAGDIIIVKPGEKIPLDGEVTEGQSSLDVSALTGESLPKEVTVKDEVLSGSINKTGLLAVGVTREYRDSAVAKIEEVLKNAGSKKSPTEKFITRFAKIYTPIVVILAASIAVIPTLVISGAKFEDWLYRALIFLVVSCPCALVLSIPIGFIGGIGSAGKRGILIKGSDYLDGLLKADTAIFDKTGTLTEGKLSVSSIASFNGFGRDEVLYHAAYSEIYSTHPIAYSVIKEYGKEIDRNKIGSFIEQAGYGVKTLVNNTPVICGNEKMMTKENIEFTVSDRPGTTIYVAISGKYAGYILITDVIKKDASDVISDLKKNGIKKIIMLTGDNKHIAESIGSQLGIDEVYSGLLPDQKVEMLEKIESTRGKNSKIVYVGDGINDAPVIARSDIGIAMGSMGSDIAVESADIVIMNDRLARIPEALMIARKTKNIVIQNIILALGIKMLVLALGAIGIATMWAAVFADVGVAFLAILNSLRALTHQLLPFKEKSN